MDSMQLVTPGIGLMFWTVVIFILLLVILKKFAWKPILDAVDDRNKSIEEALTAAEKAKKEMAELSANNEKILAEARIERDSQNPNKTKSLCNFFLSNLQLRLEKKIKKKIKNEKSVSKRVNLILFELTNLLNENKYSLT